MREMFLPYFFVMFLCGIGLGADRSGLTSGSPIIEGLVGSCVGMAACSSSISLKVGPSSLAAMESIISRIDSSEGSPC